MRSALGPRARSSETAIVTEQKSAEVVVADDEAGDGSGIHETSEDFVEVKDRTLWNKE